GDTSPRLEIPLLGEVLDLIQSQAATRLSIQPKADCVVDIVSLVGDLHAEIWVGFNDGDVAKLQLARKLMPRAHIFLDTGGSPRPVEEDIAIAKHHSFQSIVMHHSTATAERVTRIADAGLEPGAWTVNELPKMHSLRALGVTRFYTDRPRTFLATPKQ
ncbi:MAG: glycerophosphodiester phosphodiesterase, partial [Lentisphaeria bacterium]|nr:glycerophosphodiester phosphodiesterase [Lentisphaeria bacterium]